jgi:hypothetical protein
VNVAELILTSKLFPEVGPVVGAEEPAVLEYVVTLGDGKDETSILRMQLL